MEGVTMITTHSLGGWRNAPTCHPKTCHPKSRITTQKTCHLSAKHATCVTDHHSENVPPVRAWVARVARFSLGPLACARVTHARKPITSKTCHTCHPAEVDHP